MKMTPARLAWVALAISLGWCALAAAAPLLQEHGNPAGAMAIRLLQSPACHQTAERSFHLAGHPMTLCARCTGLAAGFAAGAGWLLLWCQSRPQTPPFPSRRLLAWAALPAAVEWVFEVTGLTPPAAPVRAAAAAALGFAISLFFVPALFEMCGIVNDAIRRRTAPREPTHAAGSG